MGRSVTFWSFVAIIVGYLLKYFIDLGVFRHIESHGIDQCQLLVPSDGGSHSNMIRTKKQMRSLGHLAFEDMAIDYNTATAYLSGDDRKWWHSFDLSIDTIEKRGKIYSFDISSRRFNKFDLIEYPYEHFHPLGIGLLQTTNKQVYRLARHSQCR
jgi:hypothetical protein